MIKNTIQKILRGYQSNYLVFFVLLLPLTSSSQSATPAHIKKPITTSFVFSDVEFEEMAVISNVLKIKNNNSKVYVFTITMSLPVGWRTLNNSQKEYTLAPNDSLFVPVRILTSNKSAKGGTKYNINAFIATNEGRQMALASFRAGRPKISDWQINVLPRPRMYFLNDENETSFQISLANNGDEPQELILSLNKIGKDFMVADGSGKFLKKNYSEFTLAPASDTVVPFTAVIQKQERNVKRIDNYNYLPNALEQERHFGLYIKASEVGAKPGSGSSKSNKVDFVKLGNNINFVKLNNNTRLNQYGGAVIPLTLIANVNNILGQQPIMNIILNGNTELNKRSTLNYFFQSGFTYYKVVQRTNTNSSGIINYNHEKGSVSVGSSVGLNMDNLNGITNGKGISAGYRLTKRQSVGAYYVRNGRSFANAQSTSVGAGYSARFSRLQFGAGVDRTQDTTGRASNSINGNIAVPIGRFQYVGVNAQYSVSDYKNYISTRRFYGFYYSASYLKSKANTTLNLNYLDGIVNLGPGIFVNNNYNNYGAALTNSYLFKSGFELNLVNNYSLFQTAQKANPLLLQNNIFFNNILTFRLPSKSAVNYTPSIYFNYSDYFTEKMISSGLQLTVNTYNPEDYFRLGFFLKGGYNKLLSHPEFGTFFNGQASTVLSYRTWNFNIRYSYGPIGQGNMISVLSQKKYPQTLGGSIGNQYQFRDPHFIWENTFNYNYVNINQRHSMGLFSQIYYYTNNGWRFNFNVAYNYNISSRPDYVYTPGAVNNFVVEESNKKFKSKNIQLGLGLKKDFGIPIPKRYRKTRYCNANFKIFLDINGNKKFDADEIPLENIVIRMNDFEVLSDENGECSFLNMALDKYKLQVLPLVDVGAWFAVAPDSMEVCGPAVMFIPFSKGVEILGNVVLDREKFSAGMIEKLDISRIKIFLVDSIGNVVTAITDNRGNFKFYVPFGIYRLKFDEKILGNDFELAENDIDVELVEGMESYYHTFFIIEKKRRVKNKKFGPDGSVIETEGEAESLNKLKDGNNGAGDNNGNNSSDNNNSGNNSGNTDNNKNSGSTNENVENAKTFDKGKAETDKSEGGKTTESVENLKTFGGTGKADDMNGNTNSNNKETNWAQMDSLINILIGKVKPGKEISAEDLARIEDSKITKSDLSKFENKTVYTIQIGAYNAGLPKNILTSVLKLNVKVESYKDEKDGLTKYFSGYYDTYEEASDARKEIEERGLKGPFIIAINNGEIMSIKKLIKKQGK